TCGYTLVGASIFYNIEGPHELSVYSTHTYIHHMHLQAKRASLDDIWTKRDLFLTQMFQMGRNESISLDDFMQQANVYALNMSDDLFDSFNKVFITQKEVC